MSRYGHLDCFIGLEVSDDLFRACAAKTACTAIGCVKFLNQIELRLHDGYDDHLRDAFERLDGECGIATVPSRYHEFALIIRVNQTDEVAQHHAVFVSQAAARQDHGGIIGIGQVDRQTGGNEYGLTWFEGDFFADTGAKIQAGTACCGIMRQLVFDQRIDNFDIDVHGVLSL